LAESGSAAPGGVSIYFPSGDFAEAIRRFRAGEDQGYATHDQVARLAIDLRERGHPVTLYSFLTPDCREQEPEPGLRIVSLGAPNFFATGILHDAIARDASTAVVAHFPNHELIRAATASRKRVLAILASSFNTYGPRALVQRWKLVRLLNDPRVELVSNHCLPATGLLADMGVKRDKLVAWDVPHRTSPDQHAPKPLGAGPWTLAYAGTVSELKGVGDLVRAIRLLVDRGLDVRARIAGLGEGWDELRALAQSTGIGDRVDFAGQIPNGEVLTLFRNADVVIVPSRSAFPEGFPLTMFEAIASRTPIVCSDHPVFRPVLKDGETAAMFRAGNARALADAVERTLTDSDAYARLSANADMSWERLKGPIDWRELILAWSAEGASSALIQSAIAQQRPLLTRR
jgi:glycosyltransferase involved in cell wall biosynthesis